MSETMRLEGLPATTAVLATLPRNIQKRSMSRATRAGGAPYVKAAKRNAPRLRGIFKRSLTLKVKSYRGGETHVAIAGQLKGNLRSIAKLRRARGGISGRGDVVPIHFVEEDIKPHVIPGPVAIHTPSGRVVVVQSVQHPGTRGQHVIRQAAQQAEGESVRKFTEKLSTEVDREAAAAAASA